MKRTTRIPGAATAVGALLAMLLVGAAATADNPEPQANGWRDENVALGVCVQLDLLPEVEPPKGCEVVTRHREECLALNAEYPRRSLYGFQQPCRTYASGVRSYMADDFSGIMRQERDRTIRCVKRFERGEPLRDSDFGVTDECTDLYTRMHTALKYNSRYAKN